MFREAWAEHRGQIIEAVDVGDACVTEIRWHLRAHSGVELDVVEGWAVWVRDGKITRLEQHPSKEQSIEAAGRLD